MAFFVVNLQIDILKGIILLRVKELMSKGEITMTRRIPTIYEQKKIAIQQMEQIKENEEVLNELLNIKDDKVKITTKELKEKVVKATGIAVSGGVVTTKINKIQPVNIFRIRKYEKDKTNEKVDIEKIDFKKWDKEEYLWNPPVSVAVEGRFNKNGESVLYTSYSVETCISETKIKENDIFLLITYRMKRELFLCELVGSRIGKEDPLLSKVNEIYIKCLTKSHILANCIKEIFYDAEIQFDGWECLSIPYYNEQELEKEWWKMYVNEELRNYSNIILAPEEIKDKLEIADIKIMQRKNGENRILFYGEMIAGDIKYHRAETLEENQ